jgi:hypothetical protein
VQREGDVFDGLLDAVKGEIGLSKVVVREDQSEVGLVVVENQQLIERKFLDLDVDQFLPCLVDRSLPEVVELRDDVSRYLL